MSVTDLNKDFHRIAIEERDSYLKFVYRLGESGMKEMFRFPGESFSLWWLSLIAEKSTVKSDVYEKLISFLSTGKLAPVSLRARVKGSFIYRFYLFLSGVRDMSCFVLRAIYIKFSVRNFKPRLKRLEQCDFTVVTPFPLFDKLKSESGLYENKFIPLLHRSLESQYKDKYAHICLHIDSEGLKFDDSVFLMNRFNGRQLLFLLDEFFGLTAVPALFVCYVYFSLVFILNLRKIRKETVYEYKGGKFDIWPILANDFYSSFCGPNLASSLWYIFTFRKACSHLKRGSKVIAVCEMSWWEKALYIFSRKYGLITVGYQHTRLPKLLLNYFNTRQEIRGNGSLDACPLPDYLATVGRTTADIFKEEGWPESRVFVWGAQRFTSFRDKASFFVPWDKKEDYFIYAFSISRFEAERVLFFLSEAFKHRLDYKILLKSHPNVDLKSLIKRCGVRLDADNFEIVDTDISVLAKKAKGMIVTDSSSCMYALASASPVIILRFKDRIDANLLSYISDVATYVYSPQELKDACDKIYVARSTPLSCQAANRFLDDYLYFPDSDDDYLERVKNIKSGAIL